MTLVASAYDTAMHDEFFPLVGFNPVTGMAPTQTAADKIERVFLSPRQFGDLYWHTIDHYRHLLLFLVLTGLRWGGAAGLRVRDVTLHPEKGRPYLSALALAVARRTAPADDPHPARPHDRGRHRGQGSRRHTARRSWTW